MTRLSLRRCLTWSSLALALVWLAAISWNQTTVVNSYRGRPTSYWANIIDNQAPSGFSQYRRRPEFYRLNVTVFKVGPLHPLERPFRAWRQAKFHRRVKSLDLLQAGDAAAVPVLKELLSHESELVRETAAESLKQVGPAAKSAAYALAHGLTDTEAVQEYSFQALSAIGANGQAAIPTLKAIIHAGPGVGPAFQSYSALESYSAKWPAIAAATVLHRIDPEDEDVLPMLLKALNDREEPDKRLLRQAIESLGELGPKAQVALPRLIEIINTEDENEIVEQAREVIKKLDSSAASALRLNR